MSLSLRGVVSIGVTLLLASAVSAADPAIFARARAFVGSDAALNGIKSLHYVGTLTTADPADPSKQTRATLEIVFQKPYQQRIVMTSDARIETTVLDGYDAWTLLQDPTNKAKPRLTLLGADQIKRLRANAWENLAFFAGIEKVGGRVEEQGTTTIDGTTCQKVSFIHGPNIIFIRYFDVGTGRLVLTETETGGTIREQGEMTVNGVRFPRTLVSTTKNAKGEVQTVTINFETITMNEPFSASLFAMPSMSQF